MRRAAVVIVPWVCLAACGDNTGGTMSLDEVAPRFLETSCAVDTRCGFFPDEATCLATVSLGLDQLEADVKAGRIVFDGRAASTCLGNLAATSCSRNDPEASSQPCLDAFKAVGATGALCFKGDSCVSGDCTIGACDPRTTCCPGACASGSVDIPVAAGGDCAAANSACADGTFCETTGGASTCQLRVAAGGPCDVLDACADGLVCKRDGSAAGVCVPFPDRGEACDPVALPCNGRADVCDATTARCVPAIAVGQACPSGVGCVAYAICDATNTCVAKGVVGEPCALPTDCLGSLSCRSGACAQPTPLPVCS